MHFRSLAAASIPIALAVSCAHAGETGERSTGNQETTVAPVTTERSTAATETRVVPAPVPPEPVRVMLAAGERSRTIEGSTRKSAPAVVLFAAPTEKMIVIGISSPQNKARLVIFQPGEGEPSGGTAPDDGAIRWTGAIDRAGELRVEAQTRAEGEIPFRITLEVAADFGTPVP